MAHILSPPHPFLTTRPITLENTNSRIVHDAFFRINGYSSSMESNDEDKPLDFSKKKTESSTSHLKREVFEAPNALLEHLQDIKPRNVHQANIVESPRSPPRCISPALSNNPQLYTSPPPTILMEQLAYVKALSKCNPLFPNLNLHVPLAERPDPSNKHQELLCKMMEDQNFDGSMANTREFSRNSSPPADPSSNHLKFNNSFTPIVLTPPPSTVADSHIRQEQMTKSSTFQPAEEVSILQRTLTAPQLDDSTNVQRNAKNAKQPRPFKTYNPLPRSFPASLPVMPLGAIQDLEDQEYRYQQYMDSYYTNKNSKIRSDTRSRESIDQQAGSSGDDRRESPSASDSPPRPPTSNQIKTFEDSNGSSVDVQVSRRQAADTSTSPNDSRSNKRIRSLPEELKDAAYWERRRKNNEAAKRSRDTRRQKEDFIAMRARFLEDENKNLRLTVAFLRQELSTIKCCAAHNHNRF